MSTLVTTPTRSTAVAIGTTVAAAALVAYSAYGDPHPEGNQESAVPFLIVVSCVVAGAAFGWALPRMTRGSRASRWALATGIVAVVLTPVAFWSGVPLVLGAVATVGGRRGGSRAALVLGVVAAVGSVLMAVVGNTILTKS